MFQVREEHRDSEDRILKFFLDLLYRCRRKYYLRQPTGSCGFPSRSCSREVLCLAENDKAALLNGEATVDVRRLYRRRFSRATFAPLERSLNVSQIGLRFPPVGFHRAFHTFSHFVV